MMSPVLSSSESPASWERSVWRGESAWVSVRDGVGAIVSEARSRLIYLGAPDGALNLLNAPWPRVLPGKDNPWPNQGGHRFWLGPQHRWGWPPPTEWEYAAVSSACIAQGLLVLRHAHLDPAYPALTREYTWDGSRLRCTVRWADDGRRYFGLHVVAVDTPFAITVRLEPSAAAPAGLIAARMIDPEPPLRLPHPAIAVEADRATVTAGICKAKLGFAPQPLAIERPGGWRLAVHPGPCSQANSEMPDHGYLSQVWVGDDSGDLAELEQLTPHLGADAGDTCSTTIFIEATPPKR